LLLESFEVGVYEALFDPVQHSAPVMPGLDPGIHQSSQQSFPKKMDRRVKPGQARR
jgi:hypothetical protein